MAVTFNINKNVGSPEYEKRKAVLEGLEVNQKNRTTAQKMYDQSEAYADAKTPYDPLGDLYNIASRKQGWTDANKNGDKVAMEANENYAKSSYENLYKNGYGDYANKLTRMDATTAQDYVNGIKSTMVFTPTYEGVQNKSNDLYGDLKNSSDMVYLNNINVDPTSTGYGKNILAGYGVAADGAYAKTMANGMEDAGGNVDSYAAAQANRNKAAMVQQGYDTARQYYDSISGAANNWFNSRANALQTNVDSDRNAVVNADNYATQRYGYDRDLEGKKYTTDREYALGLDSNSTQRYGYDTSLAGNYNQAMADMYAAEAASKNGYQGGRPSLVNQSSGNSVGDYLDTLGRVATTIPARESGAEGSGTQTVQQSAPVVAEATAAPAGKSVDEIAKEVLAGEWGNGAERVRRLTEAGYDAAAVQEAVNASVKQKPAVVTSQQTMSEINASRPGANDKTIHPSNLTGNDVHATDANPSFVAPYASQNTAGNARDYYDNLWSNTEKNIQTDNTAKEKPKPEEKKKETAATKKTFIGFDSVHDTVSYGGRVYTLQNFVANVFPNLEKSERDFVRGEAAKSGYEF